MLNLQEVQQWLGDLDLLNLLDLLDLIDLLDLDIMNTWLSVSRFNKTNWTAKGPDGIKDGTTSDSGWRLFCSAKRKKPLQSAVEDVRPRVALPPSPPHNTN